MSKLIIVKSIALLLAVGIVFCLSSISLQLISSNNGTTSVPGRSKDINLSIGSADKVKGFSVQKNKIYLWLSSPAAEKIIVIDELAQSKTLTVKLNKGDK